MTVTPETLADAGWEVATLGRRIGARCIDGLIGTVVTLLVYAAVIYGVLVGGDLLFVGAAVLFGVYTLVALVVMITQAATVGQLMTGLKNLNVQTGQPSGGRALLKYFVMGLVSQLTFGIVLLVALLTIQEPLRRTWFDRLAGVMVARRSTSPAARAVASPPARPAPPTAPPPLAPPSTTPPPPRPVGALGPRPVTAPLAQPAPTAALAPTPAADAPAWALPPTPDASVPTLVLDDGVTLPLDRSVVLGRDPSPPTGVELAKLVPVVDDQRSLSKTHVMVERDDRGVWVTDLHSTNGVTIEDTGGAATRLVPGARTPVPVGGRITYGKRSMRLVP